MAPEVRPDTSRIFLSYRREDSIAHVNALFHPLRERFGEDRVFKDTDHIAPGQDFTKVIRKQLETCSVLLAVIGRQWLTIQKPKSSIRRLDDPADYLRIEIATALKNDSVLVIPILVGQATMPSREELPPDLADLAHRNGFELRDSRRDSDVSLLIHAIEKACGVSGPEDARTDTMVPTELPARASATRPAGPQDSGGFGRLEVKRQYQIGEHMSEARRASEAGALELALHACEKVLLLEPQHREARELRRLARLAIDNQKIDSWLGDARRLMSGANLSDADLTAASELIDRALAINAAHDQGNHCRQALLVLRRKRERRREDERQVRAALSRAQESFAVGDFDAALEHCDDAMVVTAEFPEIAALRDKIVAAQRAMRRKPRDHASAGSEPAHGDIAPAAVASDHGVPDSPVPAATGARDSENPATSSVREVARQARHRRTLRFAAAAAIVLAVGGAVWLASLSTPSRTEPDENTADRAQVEPAPARSQQTGTSGRETRKSRASGTAMDSASPAPASGSRARTPDPPEKRREASAESRTPSGSAATPRGSGGGTPQSDISRIFDLLKPASEPNRGGGPGGRSNTERAVSFGGVRETRITDDGKRRISVDSQTVDTPTNVTQPVRLKYVPPVYPPDAVAARVEGRVTLEVVVGVGGRVQRTRVIRSIPLLDEAALNAVRQWEYSPAQLNGSPIAFTMSVSVNFTLQ